jgi:hypothetical protein
MILDEKEERCLDPASRSEIARTIRRDSDCNLWWARLAETAERSLHWLIPAVVLIYMVFKIIRALRG